jgi:hypothetical protein
MNSSISISDTRAWRPVLRRYGAICLALAFVVVSFLIASDPYDTGVFGLFDGYGVPKYGQRLTDASLARRPAVEAAIIGNSTSQLIDPARLTTLTGLRFVSLAIPGTGPIEQLAVAHWLVRHHRGGDAKPLKVLVFGLDVSWCRGDGRLGLNNPFPFWLYSDSRLEYVAHLFSLKSFEAVGRKLKLMLGLDSPFRADGYRDYDEGEWDKSAAARQIAAGAGSFGTSGPGDFAAVGRLRDFLVEVPEGAAIVLLFVPRHQITLPSPDSAAGRYWEKCKSEYRNLAAGLRRGILIDLLVDHHLVREDQNFRDPNHYRQPVARMIENAIVESLRNAERD